jgi:hypothetical protein
MGRGVPIADFARAARTAIRGVEAGERADAAAAGADVLPKGFLPNAAGRNHAETRDDDAAAIRLG